MRKDQSHCLTVSPLKQGPIPCRHPGSAAGLNGQLNLLARPSVRTRQPEQTKSKLAWTKVAGLYSSEHRTMPRSKRKPCSQPARKTYGGENACPSSTNHGVLSIRALFSSALNPDTKNRSHSSPQTANPKLAKPAPPAPRNAKGARMAARVSKAIRAPNQRRSLGSTPPSPSPKARATPPGRGASRASTGRSSSRCAAGWMSAA